MKYVTAALLTVFLFVSACSQVATQVKGIVTDDLARTSELADKYGKSEVKACADFLASALNSQDSVQARLDALLAEPTAGLLSAAFKAALIAELVKSLNDPAAQAKLQKDFDVACRAVAGQIMLNLARDARKAMTRGN